MEKIRRKLMACSEDTLRLVQGTPLNPRTNLIPYISTDARGGG